MRQASIEKMKKQRPWIENSQIKAIIHSQYAYEKLPNYVNNHISAFQNVLCCSDGLSSFNSFLSVIEGAGK